MGLGLIFGWLRWRAGRTTVPMIAHATLNALPDTITVALSAVPAIMLAGRASRKLLSPRRRR
jgi:membrane protease YdiL (CAAX protease family)